MHGGVCQMQRSVQAHFVARGISRWYLLVRLRPRAAAACCSLLPSWKLHAELVLVQTACKR